MAEFVEEVLGGRGSLRPRPSQRPLEANSRRPGVSRRLGGRAMAAGRWRRLLPLCLSVSGRERSDRYANASSKPRGRALISPWG